jgi:uncharacterized Zn-finger protein
MNTPQNSHKNTQNKTAYQVSKHADLTCPLPGSSQWNWHPKIYLPIEKTGRVKCPYCSTEYFWEGCEDAPLTDVYG